MSRRLFILCRWLAAAGLLSSTGCGSRSTGPAWRDVPADAIDSRRLAEQATDPEHMVRALAPHEQARLFSSAADTNKVMLAAFAPHLTGDLDHGFYLRVSDLADGTVEATIAETWGPGYIGWCWSANPAGELLLYIDGTNEPALRQAFADFLEARSPGPGKAYATRTGGGYNLHLPIVHSNYCRMALRAPDRATLGELYYQVAWNALPSNACLVPFDRRTWSSSRLRPLDRPVTEVAVTRKADLLLPAGGTAVVWQASAPCLVKQCVLETPDRDRLADVDLMARWDGDATPAIDAPVSLIAGCSPLLEEMKSQVAGTGRRRISLGWPMPCASGRIALRNRGGRAVRISVTTVERTGVTTAMRLFAFRKRCFRLPLSGRSELVLAELAAAGRIAGIHLIADSRGNDWWGEGDVIIRLDGGNAPAWQTSGTEDYFGLAWCSTSTFAEPWRGQSLVRRRNTGRTTALHRLHALEELPFHRAADVRLEVTGAGSGDMDLDALVLVYRQAETARFNLPGQP